MKPKYNKVVIIIPPSPWLISDTDLPPLGPLYVASYLREFGSEVQVCDLSGLEEKDWKIPIGDIYGVGGASPNFVYIKAIVARLKAREPDKPVVVGGVHATVLPYHVLDNTLADACVVGEGEITMREVMAKGLNQSVNGLLFKNGKSVVVTTDRHMFQDVDDFGIPDYDSIDFYRYAKSQTFKYLLGDCREGMILSARGCPFDCVFCASPKLWKRKVRYRSVGHVIGEVELLRDKYGVELIYFVDDTFVLNQARVLELCSKLKQTSIKWHCLNRVDKADEKVLATMKKSGCVGVVYGFESGDNTMLERINKWTTIEQGYKAIEATKKVGLKVRGQLMVGLPGETDESVENTAKFIRSAKDVDTFGVHVFQPYPGCYVWSNPDKYSFSIDKETDFSRFHTIGKPGAELTDNRIVADWFNYLRDVAKEKNIEQQGAMDAS
jgi:anaerobic magnesium-protoporphyrin IX monomethyl ester cyclase